MLLSKNKQHIYHFDGIYSHVDHRDKLVISFLPNDTYARANMAKLCIDGHAPFDEKAFYVTPMRDIDLEKSKQLLGREVRVSVYMYKYAFESKYETNKGQKISGTTLKLYDIRPL